MNNGANTITDEEFRLLRDFVTQKCGIFYNERQKYIFQQKVLKRLEKNTLKSYKEYYYLLKYGAAPEELQHLYNTLTVNETYFFREKDQLLSLSDIIIKEMLESRPNRFIKVLSAGCATGEETYTFSMLINETFNSAFLAQNVSILGLDISNKALETARSANYRKISLTFRAMEAMYLEKYFEDLGDSYKVKDFIKNTVRFRSFNLMDSPELMTLGKFDIILCRNVMIYFEKSYKQELINCYHKMLSPGGYLVLSNTENLNDVNHEFNAVKKGNSFFYQKK